MSKKFNTLKLLYVFGTLVVILLLTIILKVPKEKATLKDLLLEIDTADVSKIIVTPKYMEGEAFEFLRSDNRWEVRQSNLVAKPASGAIQSIFSEILSLKPKSLAAVDNTKWEEFELTDTLSTRLGFINSRGRELASIMIGKFSYSQAANPYNYYGGNNIEGTSYVRINDEKEVYAVDGFLAVSFSGKFSDWRDRTFIRAKKDDILKISFTFPSDSSYLLEKKENTWFAGNKQADSALVASYLNTLSFLDGQDFKDGFTPVSNPVYQMVVEGNNLLNLSVKCFAMGDTDEYVLTSNLNPSVYFTGKRSGLFSQVFKPESYFLKK